MRIKKFVTFIPCFALAATLALPLAGRSLMTAQSNAWLPVSSPTTERLYGVYCSATDDCWAVGSGGTIIHYDGTTWTAVESSIDFHLRSVFCPADDDCWAVGEDGRVAHYDGSIWSISAVLPSTNDLRSVFCNTVDDCWTVGVWNRIFHYDGASWTSVYSPGSGWSRLTSVSCAAVNDCWAVSDLGYVSHYDGTHWSASRPTTNQLEGLFCLAIDDCWAVGYRCVLRHYDGDQWTTVSSPNSDHLYSVFCAASDDCWAVGDGSIIHYNGSAWSNVLDGVSLQSVFCSAADDCWAVGGDGAILHYTPTRQVFLPLVFKRYPPPPPGSFSAVSDAYVLQGYPDSNFGSASDMWVGYDDYLSPDGRIARSLIRFDLSAIPAGTAIDSAVLRVYRVDSWDYPNKTRTITTYRIGSNWSESSVTWNTVPGFAEAYGSAGVTHGAGDWYSFDVTHLVRGWMNNSYNNYGIMLRGPEHSGSDSSWKSFSTREGVYAPQLIVTYSGYAAQSLVEVEEARPARVENGMIELLTPETGTGLCRDALPGQKCRARP